MRRFSLNITFSKYYSITRVLQTACNTFLCLNDTLNIVFSQVLQYYKKNTHLNKKYYSITKRRRK